MAEATRWETEYERTTQECIDANALALADIALNGSPRVWPISGDGVTEWNPDGFPMLKKKHPPLHRWVDPTLHDERTPLLSSIGDPRLRSKKA